MQQRVPPPRDAYAGAHHCLHPARLLLDTLPRWRRRVVPAHLRLAGRGRPALVLVHTIRVGRCGAMPESDIQPGLRLPARMDYGRNEHRAGEG